MSYQSVLEMFLDNVATRGPRLAALAKRDGAYREFTWKELGDESRRIASGLVALGLNPGDRVVILSQSRLEWVLTDLGILAAGGVTVPIYSSNLPDECQFILADSEAVLAFTEDATQSDKLRNVKNQLPGVRRVIQLTGAVPADDPWVMGFSAFLAQPEPPATELEQRRHALKPDSMLTIIYTSGTTGRPKGVVLTHDSMVYEAEAVNATGILLESDVQLFFLPLAHVFAKVLAIAWIGTKSVMAFAESLQTIREDLAATHPTIMAGVPRVYEKFYNGVLQKGTAPGGLKAKLFNQAAELSYKNGEAESRDDSLPIPERLKFAVLKKLVFSKVAHGLGEILGGRMRVVVSGGAPLSPRIGWFFRDAGLEVIEGYGLTETSAATFANRPGHSRIGTVGPPMPGTEVRIAQDGEVFVKGRCVMREYWKNPEATAEVLKDGWIATGDIGKLDAAGHLKITDRKKDIIVTAGGKNVAPQNIENLFKAHKLISQAVVHGDKRKFISALITLEPEALKAFARDRGLGEASYAELSQRLEVYKEVQRLIDSVNGQLASYESIKKFKILEHDLSQETGEITPSLKVKRKLVYERYQLIFDAFYDESY